MGPKLYFDQGRLVVRTSWVDWFFRLGFSQRTLIVDPLESTLELACTSWWGGSRTRRQIGFEEVARLRYSYQDLNVFTAWGGSGTTRDCYTVGLELKRDGEQVELFRFEGLGTFVNNSDAYPDWWYEERGGGSGGPQVNSRLLVLQLSKLLDVPLI